MKKVLFAATALAAAGSMAAAEVRISGYGRFGLDYNSGSGAGAGNSTNTNGVAKTTITSRLRLQFDMSAETDGGVAFGARFRAQAESRDNNPGGATFNGARFFVRYEGLTVFVGNIIGAVENTPGLYLETRTAGTGVDGAGFVSNVANVNNEYFNWDAYSSAGNGRNGLEAIYSAGGFTGHISYSQNNVGVATGGAVVAANNNGTGNYGLKTGESRLQRVALMGAYTFGDWTVAASYQDSTALYEQKFVLTVQGDIGNFGVRAAYADNDGISKWGLYGNMDIGAASNVVLWVTDESAVSATDVAAGRADNRDSVATSNQQEGTSYGIHYSYDLGGGVSFETGYRRSSSKNDTFQAGVYFSF